MIVKERQVINYLSPSKIGSFAINPYIGCPNACKYCYASFMKRFTNHPEPWGTFIDIKRCDKKIDIRKITGKNVFMSTVTDCYNPYEEKYRITRGILEQLVNADCFLQISTKNNLVLRDLDLFSQMKNISVVMSINTPDDNFRQDMDCASSILERLETLKTLNENSINTILFMSPIFLHITNWQAIIEVTKGYVNEFWFEDLNLRGGYKRIILDYVKEKYPDIFPSYIRLYKQGDRTEITKLEKDICYYCNINKINYTDYFHHAKILNDRKNKMLYKKHRS